MLTAALALTLAFAPPESGDAVAPVVAPADTAESEPEPEPTNEPESTEPEVRGVGTIVLAPTEPGEYRLYDNDGHAVGGPMALGDGQAPTLQLSEGIYHVHGPDGIDTLVVGAGLELAWDGERVVPTPVWQAALEQERRAYAQAQAQAQADPPAPELTTGQGTWRTWASPLGSTLIPGLGQFLNGQGGKGTGILFATIGSTAGAAALYSLGNDGTRGNGAEYARLIGFGTLSTSAMLLWVYGIADAYRVATGKTVEPELDHKLRVSLTRMMTVGFRADANRPGFYDDWGLAIMGQATRRLTVGVSDLSVKFGGNSGNVGHPQVWQFGARLDYRVFDRKRLWVDLGVGSIMQVVIAQQPDPLDPDVGSPGSVTGFGAAPYGLLDLRVFVLDRVSIDFVPRMTVPLTTRFYSVNRALPRYAPELELGAGISTYF